MMPVIRVSDKVIEILEKFARPFKDTPNSTLERVLEEYARMKLQGVTAPREERVMKGPRYTPSQRAEHPQYPRPHAEKYVRLIIASLKSLGGRASAQEVIAHIYRNFRDQFDPEDLESIRSGDTRWTKKVNWARYDMVQGGLLKKDSPRGIWELTEKGISYA
jgi:hypothetical protein